MRSCERIGGEPLFLVILIVGIGLWVGSRRLGGRNGAASWVPLVRWGGLAGGIGLVVWAGTGMWGSGDPQLFNGFRVTLFYALGTIPPADTCGLVGILGTGETRSLNRACAVGL